MSRDRATLDRLALKDECFAARSAISSDDFQSDRAMRRYYRDRERETEEIMTEEMCLRREMCA